MLTELRYTAGAQQLKLRKTETISPSDMPRVDTTQLAWQQSQCKESGSVGVGSSGTTTGRRRVSRIVRAELTAIATVTLVALLLIVGIFFAGVLLGAKRITIVVDAGPEELRKFGVGGVNLVRGL